jgi:hypothetical protein
MVGAPGFSDTTTQGVRRRRPALSGSHPQTSGKASQGATMSRTFFSKKKLGPCAAKDLER